MFFVSPGGEEFRGPAETEGYDALDDEDDEEGEEPEETTIPGEETTGWAVGISLAARVAVICWSGNASYEDGTREYPSVCSPGMGDEPPGEPLDEPPGEASEESAETPLSEAARKKMETLRERIGGVLAKHRIRLLEDSILGLKIKGLRAEKEVFVEPPVTVFDAFFFRGV